MNIEILCATNRPLDIISQAAGMSRGKTDINHRRVKTCYRVGHFSVFEHAAFTARVSGISRACSHQLVRHRLASFCQESQRYTTIDQDTDWYVKPPVFMDYTDWFDRRMRECMSAYQGAISRPEVNPEDARYLLPEATKTSIVLTMNVREFFHFLNLRTKQDAQWEIRDLANSLIYDLSLLDPQWSEIVDLWRDSPMFLLNSTYDPNKNEGGAKIER